MTDICNNYTWTEVRRLTFLEFQQQYADGKEYHHPDAGRYEARINDRVADRPAALRYRAQAFRRFG